MPKHTIAVICLALAGALALLGPAHPVQAHEIEVLRSDPADGALLAAAPAAVQVWFGSELAIEGSTLQVYDASGAQVDSKNGGVDLADATHTSMKVSLPALADGVYVARWQATLPDGDSVLGTFQFTVSTSGYPAEVEGAAPTGVTGTNAAYPAADPQDQPGGVGAYLSGVFKDRDSLVGAAIGGLAVLLGLLVLIRKLTAGRN